MPWLAGVLIIAGWMFSYALIAVAALVAAASAPNPDSIKWVGLTIVFNACCYLVALHYLLKYKHLCDMFIEE